MGRFNPYLVDEIVVQSEKSNAKSDGLFGLIGKSDNSTVELHGFEITMSGRLVLPELRAQPEHEIALAAK
ncbi:MAG: hypothetical protein AAB401_23215 [Acidobacteriota bacterium]|mgnify:CR=1 FL=1